MNRTALLLLFAFTTPLLCSSVAEADILWFKNGRSLEGSIRELPDGKVEITLPYGTLAVSKSQVERIEKAVSVADIVDQALATLRPTDTERLFELAEWCREKREYTLAQRLYEKVLAADPNHQGARQQLGYEYLAGRWLTREEARLARGEIPFRGRWVSRQERDHVLAEERSQQRRDRLEDLEEARLALEVSRYELEAERARRLPPASGHPIYPYGSGFISSPGLGFFHHQQTDLPWTDPLPQASAPEARPEERRHRSAIPRHQRGGFTSPRRR